ncbi:hypothetical protein OUZ56_033227 [Daphnia magna]|uniref:Uncharacterized protein n=1 Tax=Daphnia magna TaxID=35525 RepID=A0ABR0BAH5_9CRUS|nr:hypothetical protein OUZ56_033227 [Daphnia magna]
MATYRQSLEDSALEIAEEHCIQCIHIEYKSKNSWYNSVFTLNTKVETHEVETHEVKTHEVETHDQRNGGKQCITLTRDGRGREHNVMNRLASQD